MDWQLSTGEARIAVTSGRKPQMAQVWLRTEAGICRKFLCFEIFAWDRLASRIYAATATKFLMKLLLSYSPISLLTSDTSNSSRADSDITDRMNGPELAPHLHIRHHRQNAMWLDTGCWSPQLPRYHRSCCRNPPPLHSLPYHVWELWLHRVVWKEIQAQFLTCWNVLKSWKIFSHLESYLWFGLTQGDEINSGTIMHVVCSTQPMPDACWCSGDFRTSASAGMILAPKLGIFHL